MRPGPCLPTLWLPAFAALALMRRPLFGGALAGARSSAYSGSGWNPPIVCVMNTAKRMDVCSSK
jgi:hypothetical protein